MMKRSWKLCLSLLLTLALLLSLPMAAFGEGAISLPEEEEQTEPALTEDQEQTEPSPEGEPGGITRIDGGEAGEEPAPVEYTEIFVSALGSDEYGDGTVNLPYASLARAAEAANQAETSLVYVLVMSDLCERRMAHFEGRNVILMGLGGTWVLQRGEDFMTNEDSIRGVYNPAMIELGRPDGTVASGSLSVENLILDDMGRHMAPLPEPEQPRSEEDKSEAPEPEGETPDGQEPAGETAPEEEAEVEVPSPEPEPLRQGEPLDLRTRAQEAIIAVYADGVLTLSGGTELRNFGGFSALRLTGCSRLVMEEGSAIRDTLGLEMPAYSALKLEEQASAQVFDGAKLQERPGAAPSVYRSSSPAAQAGSIISEQDKAELGTLELTVDKAALYQFQDNAGLFSYNLNYTLRFAVSEKTRDLIESAQQLSGVSACGGTIKIVLDSRLNGDVESAAFTSSVFELDGEVSYDEQSKTLTAPFKTRSDWQSHLSELTDPMSFTLSASLPRDQFTPSTAEKDEILATSAQIHLTVETSRARLLDMDSSSKIAQTKMLSFVRSASVSYNVNGGDPAPVPNPDPMVAEQAAYPLDTETVPTHPPVDGTDVLFLGWSAQADPHIYAAKETRPETLTQVSVPRATAVVVYAAWGFDGNGDGIADVDQILVTLSFDPNGGTGEPAPIVAAANTDLGVSVDIPEQEPTRDYYSFDGWSEDPNATQGEYKYDAEKAAKRDLVVKGDMTLYAVWKLNYTLYYDANGGSNAPAPQTLLTMSPAGTNSSGATVYAGRLIITSEQPSREGYTFQGWAVTRRGAASYFAGDEAEISGGDVTLYAAWTRNSGSSSGTAGTNSSSGSSSNPSGRPKTGDTNNPVFFVALALAALVAVVLVLIFLLKKNKKDTGKRK